MNRLFPFGQEATVFADRIDAGRQLARALKPYRGGHPLILALPRGGVVIGYEIARLLKIPLDVIVSRKIGDPGNLELGIGAVAENGVKVLDLPTIRHLHISREDLDDGIAREREEMRRRIRLYRHDRPLPYLRGRTAIIVDDGLATGVTAEASIRAVKKMHPEKIIFAVPVCSGDVSETIRGEVDDFICLFAPVQLQAIGMYYRRFGQVTDREVIELLNRLKYKGSYHSYGSA